MKNNLGLPSVTQVLGILRKPELENWYKYNTADYCNIESKKAKQIGTLIHEVIQKHIEKKEIAFETEYPNEVKNCLQGFFLFKKDYPNLNLQLAEQEIINNKHQYIGHIDCIAIVNYEVIILDWKTGKCNVGKEKEVDRPPVYPEHRYQVSAYVAAYSESIALVNQAKVLVLAKDKVAYTLEILEKYDLKNMFNQVFLPALSIYNYTHKKNEKEKTNE